ncbi:hypothetical protein AHF37_07464, partial [Paragonimus kellicotti]
DAGPFTRSEPVASCKQGLTLCWDSANTEGTGYRLPISPTLRRVEHQLVISLQLWFKL